MKKKQKFEKFKFSSYSVVNLNLDFKLQEVIIFEVGVKHYYFHFLVSNSF